MKTKLKKYLTILLGVAMANTYAAADWRESNRPVHRSGGSRLESNRPVHRSGGSRLEMEVVEAENYFMTTIYDDGINIRNIRKVGKIVTTKRNGRKRQTEKLTKGKLNLEDYYVVKPGQKVETCHQDGISTKNLDFALLDGSGKANERDLKELINRFQLLANKSEEIVRANCKDSQAKLRTKQCLWEWDRRYLSKDQASVIIFVRNVEKLKMKRIGNVGVVLKNVLTFAPHLAFEMVWSLGNNRCPLEGYAKLKRNQTITLPEHGWHFHEEGNHIKRHRIFIRADEASMKNAMIYHFRLDEGCRPRGIEPGWPHKNSAKQNLPT